MIWCTPWNHKVAFKCHFGYILLRHRRCSKGKIDKPETVPCETLQWQQCMKVGLCLHREQCIRMLFFFCAIRFTAQPRRWSAETMENSHAKWKVLEAKSGGNRYFSRCHRVPARGGFGNSLMCARGELGILDTISQPILMLKHLFCLSRILFRW